MDGPSIQARVVADGAGLAAAERLQASASTTSPAEAAKKFEELFATLLVKEMRSSLSEGFFGAGPQSDVYGGWLDQFVGAAIARDGGLHLAEGLERSLERKQAAERAAQAANKTESAETAARETRS
jgi:Rod binding domain-containing protein